MSTNTPRQFMSAVGGLTNLDELLVDQERRKVNLEGELIKTESRLADLEQRLQAHGPPTYTQLELAQALADTRNRHAHVTAQLDHLNLQLEETRKRIAAFDRQKASDATGN